MYRRAVKANPDNPAFAEKLADLLIRLGRLPEAQTELEGLTQKEAADMLGISLSGMKSRVQRGRARLRAKFEQCCAIAQDARGKVTDCDPRPAGGGPSCGR